MIRAIGAIIMALMISGCMTAQEKLVMYGCHYCPDESGWCCLSEVPAADHYIFDCKNAIGLYDNGTY